MNTVRIADLKNNLSRHLARVRRGGEITVYDRDTPVARIVPFAASPSSAPDRPRGATTASARIADLVRQGVLSPGEPQALAEWVEGRMPVKRPAGTPSAVNLLLKMRRESTR